MIDADGNSVCWPTSSFCECCSNTDLFCFFFQAEDGIRDLTVTGVQTCAPPISHEGAETSEKFDPDKSLQIRCRYPRWRFHTREYQPHPRRSRNPARSARRDARPRSEEHTSELQSQSNLVCRLLLENKTNSDTHT